MTVHCHASARGEQLERKVTLSRPAAEATELGLDDDDVPAKLGRLGMNVMGQAFFPRELMKPFGPASVRTVAIVVRDDSVLRPLAETFGIEVVIDPLGGSVDREPDDGTTVLREAVE